MTDWIAALFTGPGILFIAAAVLVLLPPKWDPAILWKERNERKRRGR